MEGLENLVELNTLDVSYNKIEKIECVSHLTKLTDLWANNNNIDGFDAIEELVTLSKTKNGVYLIYIY